MSEPFGKYELIRRIGKGGMAEVFFARTHGAEGFVKKVVIKRLLPPHNAKPGFVKMFIAEARTAAALHHANIVQIYEFDQIDGTFYIAMEWVDGADLAQINALALQRGGPIPEVLALHVGCETLKGLQYAHMMTDESGEPLRLIHRDVSPQNLLLSTTGEVKIADFGIAKVAAAYASTTRTGEIKGKLGYMSPEQACGGKMDHRSDIFSLGLVLWEAFAGHHPYASHGTSDRALFAAVAKGQIAPLTRYNPRVAPEIVAVIQRMLEPSPEQRYPTALDALRDLSRLVSAADVLDVPALLQPLLAARGGAVGKAASVLRRAPSAAAAPPQLARDAEAAPPAARGAVALSAISAVRRALSAGIAAVALFVRDARRKLARREGALRHAVPREGASLSTSVVIQTILAGIAAFTLFALGVGWLVASDAPPAPTASAETAVATVRVEPWPGAEIIIGGISLGRANAVTVTGPAASRLRVVARQGKRVSSRDVLLVEGARISLRPR